MSLSSQLVYDNFWQILKELIPKNLHEQNYQTNCWLISVLISKESKLHSKNYIVLILREILKSFDVTSSYDKE